MFDAYEDYLKRVEVNCYSRNGYVENCVIYHTNKYITYDTNSSFSFTSDITDEFYDASSTELSNIIQYEAHKTNTHRKPIQVTNSEPDYLKQRSLFAWLPTETIKKTYELTTQYARLPMSIILKKRYMSPNPALNVHRRSEPVATDTIYSNTPAIDNGCLLYTSPSPRDRTRSRMPSSA